MRDIIKNGAKWFVTGVRLFRKNVGTSWRLTKRVAVGHGLTIRERNLLTKTTADCLRIVPFSLFIIIPFAEFLLPVALRFFPGLMPSTFFKDKYDDATLARKLQAKQEMAEFWQEVVAQRTQSILESEDHEHADKAEELQAFQEKLMSGSDYPSTKEILRFSTLFAQELQLSALNAGQLRAMSKILGLTPMTFPNHNLLQLRHHIVSLRREDRDYLWEGIEGLTKNELIEACKKRAIRFHGVTEADMRRELDRWLNISRHKSIPTSLLLWIQSFSLTSEEIASGFKAPDKPEPKDFQVTVEPPPEVDPEPKDAFDSAEQAVKASLETAEKRLMELEKEIEEVTTEEAKESADSGNVQESVKVDQKPPKKKKKPDPASTAMELEQDEKRAILNRIEELSQAHELKRVIIARQADLLNHQLEFMSHMRDNHPEHAQDHGDANRILLDQRVRLVEMMNTFKKDMADIEILTDEALDASETASLKEGDLDWITNLFNQLDLNKDGVISRREFEKAARKMKTATSPVGREQAERLSEVALGSQALEGLAAVGSAATEDAAKVAAAAPGKLANGIREHKDGSSSASLRAS
jgi:LETM1 and EF-hand domain-containing protein 1